MNAKLDRLGFVTADRKLVRRQISKVGSGDGGQQVTPLETFQFRPSSMFGSQLFRLLH